MYMGIEGEKYYIKIDIKVKIILILFYVMVYKVRN